jgi:hypothetical protein
MKKTSSIPLFSKGDNLVRKRSEICRLVPPFDKGRLGAIFQYKIFRLFDDLRLDARNREAFER